MVSASSTSVACSVLFDMVKLANKALTGQANSASLAAIETQFNQLGGDVLGIIQENYDQAGGGSDELIGQLVELLLVQRANARKNKDFATSDLLRDKLTEMGVVIKDTPQGAEWSLA